MEKERLNILLIGKNGFIGKNLYELLSSSKYNITSLSRNELDVTKFSEVEKTLKSKKYDFVINCASDMRDSPAGSFNNVKSFLNFYLNRGLFGHYITFGSGAEYGPVLQSNPMLENNVNSFFANTFYGLGKKVISNLCEDTSNFISLRLFGCFGKYEKDFRLLKRFKKSTNVFNLQNNRLFDYFWVEDIIPVLEYIFNYKTEFHNINLTYSEKIDLFEFLERFKVFHRCDTEIIMDGQESRYYYIGDNNRLLSMNIKLQGLDAGLQKYE